MKTRKILAGWQCRYCLFKTDRKHGFDRKSVHHPYQVPWYIEVAEEELPVAATEKQTAAAEKTMARKAAGAVAAYLNQQREGAVAWDHNVRSSAPVSSGSWQPSRWAVDEQPKVAYQTVGGAR